MATDVGDSTLISREAEQGGEEDQLISVDWAFEVQSGVRRAEILGLSLLMGINVVVITYDVRSHLVATVMMLGDNMSKSLKIVDGM